MDELDEVEATSADREQSAQAQALKNEFAHLQASSLAGGTVIGVNRESVENYAVQELSSKDSRKALGHILNHNRNNGEELISFGERFKSYVNAWDLNESFATEKGELEVAVGSTDLEEQLIARIALKHFDTLESIATSGHLFPSLFSAR